MVRTGYPRSRELPPGPKDGGQTTKAKCGLVVPPRRWVAEQFLYCAARLSRFDIDVERSLSTLTNLHTVSLALFNPTQPSIPKKPHTRSGRAAFPSGHGRQ